MWTIMVFVLLFIWGVSRRRCPRTVDTRYGKFVGNKSLLLASRFTGTLIDFSAVSELEGVIPFIQSLDVALSPNLTRIQSLRTLRNLTALDCSGCSLTDLPELPENISRLVLRRNRFTSVPPACIFDLTAIVHLDLGKNALTTVDERFATFSSMQHLELDNNNLGRFPPPLMALEALVHVNLSDTGMDELPVAAVEAWSKLTTLLLSGNRLRTLPGNVARLAHLRFVDVARNPITALPSAVAALARENPPRLRVPLPDLVVDRLYIGGVDSAVNREALCHLNISHVLIVSRQLQPAFQTELVYRVIEAADSLEEDLLRVFEGAIEFIDEGRTRGTGILVHCQQGVSRSATIVTAYLMRTRGMTYSGALDFLRARRPTVNPNSHFRRQLVQYERRLRPGSDTATSAIVTPVANPRVEARLGHTP